MKRLILLFIAVFASYFSFSQEKVCDMEMDFPIDEDTVIVPFGETLNFFVRILNHGPDDFEEGDELMFKIVGSVIPKFTDEDNIPNGTFKDYIYFSHVASEDQTEDDLVEYCFEILESVSYTDPVPDNNIKCIQVIYQGSNTTNIKEQKKHANAVLLYPNPLKDGILQLTDLPKSRSFNISIRDILGKVVEEFSFADYQNEISLDLSALNNGLYFIEWNDGYQSIVNKLVVEK